MQLYKLRIRPHLEYASVVWSPHLEKDKKMLEDVQKFGLRMSTKHWDLEYSILLHELNLESLERHRGIARLCLLYKIINSICYFNSIFAILVHITLTLYL